MCSSGSTAGGRSLRIFEGERFSLLSDKPGIQEDPNKIDIKMLVGGRWLVSVTHGLELSNLTHSTLTWLKDS